MSYVARFLGLSFQKGRVSNLRQMDAGGARRRWVRSLPCILIFEPRWFDEGFKEEFKEDLLKHKHDNPIGSMYGMFTHKTRVAHTGFRL